jgi:ribosomal protein S18 acetylase RimI-like enzyme
VVDIRILRPADVAVLDDVAPNVFDGPVRPDLAKEFLVDPRHHMAVATSDSGRVVGMASAVHYVHPDKLPQLFINEVGVSPVFQDQGIGKQLVAALLARGKELGCTEAWVATEPDNLPAQALYTSSGGLRAPTPIVMFVFPLETDRLGVATGPVRP